VPVAIHPSRTAHILPWPERTSTVHHPPPSVLLIEAYEDTRELYHLWLTQRDFTVTGTASSDAALAAVRCHVPDIIVAELMVPGGGVPLVRALRATPGCRDTILIVLTTQASGALREHAVEAGADCSLVKPCGVIQLGEAMVVASRHRARLVTPDYGDRPSSARVRLAVARSRAIRDRLATSSWAAELSSDGLH
jgi:DNA-binding response OmpR family regulator